MHENDELRPFLFDLRRLRYERQSRRITAIEMGRQLGISANAYYKKERGESGITVDEFGLMLAVMNIPTTDIASFFTQE